MIPPNMPTAEELKPFLAKLEAEAGSVVLIAIEWPRETQNFARWSAGWFNADARQRLKRALSAEKRREAKA